VSILARRSGANDRLGLALCLALALHSLLLLIDFESSPPAPASQSLEITIASFHDDIEPDKADFLAQNHQHGSGDAREKQAPSTPEPAPFAGTSITPVQPQEQRAIQPRAQVSSRVLTTLGKTPERTERVLREQKDADLTAPETQVSLWQRSLEIASMEAQLRETRQLDAKGPRVRQITAASARQTRDAYYLDTWRRKVEAVGNLNYPAEARRRQLFGELRLMVAVKSDGSLAEVRLLKSSGFRVLDDAAIRIVQLAAPFAAFPPELRADTDVLEIVRTWRFEKGDQVSSF
jgi:protein TonB